MQNYEDLHPHERLKILRKDILKLSQIELSKALDNYKQSNLSKTERGDRHITLTILTKLYEKFNVNSNWLLYGKGDIFMSANDGKVKSKSSANLLQNDIKANETSDEKENVKRLFDIIPEFYALTDFIDFLENNPDLLFNIRNDLRQYHRFLVNHITKL